MPGRRLLKIYLLKKPLDKIKGLCYYNRAKGEGIDKMANAKAERLMKALGCTEEEALDIIQYDRLVDQGKPTPYDLTEEQKKVEKAMKNSDIHAKSEQRVAKPKENPKKEGIITAFAEFLEGFGAESVIITNKTREITFKIGEDDYKLALTATRKKK